MRSISASTRAISASAAGVSVALVSSAPSASPLSVVMIVTAPIIKASVKRALVISNLHRPHSGGPGSSRHLNFGAPTDQGIRSGSALLHDALARAPRRRPVDHGWPGA